MTSNDASRVFDSRLSPTVVCVPCFSGAPWDLASLPGLDGLPTRTMRLPENVDSVEAYADFLAQEVEQLDSFILAGDSFGAVIALALAARQPDGLHGLVLSGGFAANPLPRWKGVAAHLSKFAKGALYRQGTLRFHSFQLASEFDTHAEVPHTRDDFRELFLTHTPRSSYTARVTSVTSFNILDSLGRVDVPTLIITPADDRLVGRAAATAMLRGIRRSTEVVLPRTGHMFRFTHPSAYSAAIRSFVDGLSPVHRDGTVSV
jgi:pimeloyl-ACP methyl ester carboxylesterase